MNNKLNFNSLKKKHKYITEILQKRRDASHCIEVKFFCCLLDEKKKDEMNKIVNKDKLKLHA